MAINSQDRKNNFLNKFEDFIESCDDSRSSNLFVKRDRN